MPWVTVAPGKRYFMTEDGEPFLVIGHNDAMPWPTLMGMQHERDIASVESYIKMLVDHGVTVLRIMLEYCQDNRWFFEKPVGKPLAKAVRYWDNLVGLCERYKLRLLVLFWDTFFMARRWKQHPYAQPGTGFEGPWSFCTSPQAMEAEKARIKFFIERWGNSPAIFGYDILNEIHPHWGGTPEEQCRWVTEMARFIKECETARWGKSHLLTLSVFGARPEDAYRDLVLRHPALDFATTHVYEFGPIDNPDNVIDCAIVMRDSVRFAFEQMVDDEMRPYTDTESGPIHLFMDLEGNLEDEFENEYYHNMSWAHLATGGAGSGMRWPFRNPHHLTPGMHEVQKGMARFVASCALDWNSFSPNPVDHLLAVEGRCPEARCEDTSVLCFGCGDAEQALFWLLRDFREREITEEVVSHPLDLSIRCMEPGNYNIEFWETYSGVKLGDSVPLVVPADQGVGAERDVRLALPLFEKDLAITVTRVSEI